MELTIVGLVNVDYGNYGQNHHIQMDDLCFFASSTMEVKVVSENTNEKKSTLFPICVFTGKLK